MPIISFNISDNLKKFLKKMVTRDEYKNNSYVIRDALVRLMAEKDGAKSEIDLEDLASIAAILPKVNASLTVTADRSNSKIIRKLNKIEFEFHEFVMQKTTFIYRDIKTISYLIEGSMGEVQEFITHLNSVEDIQSFRYYIHEPSKE